MTAALRARAIGAALAVACAACGGGGSSGTGDATSGDAASGPDVDGLDLLVGSAEVVAFVGFTASWGQGPPRFPQPGACAETSIDGSPTGTTCLGSLVVGGVMLGSPHPGGIGNPYRGAAPTADTSLVWADCGVTVDVPIHPGAAPAVSDLVAVQTGSGVDVRWSTDAASLVVSAPGPYFTTACHETSATEHFFEGLDASTTSVTVQAFAAPEVSETALGEVRVWYGDVTSADVTQGSAASAAPTR